MIVHIQCPACRCLCAADESTLGKRLRCPKCAEVFTAPASASAAAPAAEPAVGIQAGRVPPRPVSDAEPPVVTGPVSAAPRSIARPSRSIAAWILGGVAVVAVLTCGIGMLGGAMLWVLLRPRAPVEPQPAVLAAPPAAQGDQLPAVADVGGNADPLWTMDLTKMNPPNRPLAGRVFGVDFAPRVQMQNTGIDLVSGNNRIHIFLTGRPGLDVYEFAADGPRFGRPSIHVHIMTTNPPGVAVYATGYTMRLVIGTEKNGSTPCSLYLCLPDDRKSCIAGTFTLESPPGAAVEDDLPPFGKAEALPAEPWTLDLRKMNPPDQPLAGTLYGAPFKPTVQLQNTGLDLVSGHDRMHMFLTPRPGKQVYAYSAAGPFHPGRPSIHIHAHSMNPPRAGVFTNGYAMRLEFGKYKDGRTPGRMYLCLPDDQKSFIAGSFTLDFRGLAGVGRSGTLLANFERPGTDLKLGSLPR